MFELARAGLVDMAEHVPAYRKVAQRPRKFCRGFGIFQLDLQFFEEDPDYFLHRRYARFAHSAAKAVRELNEKAERIGLGDRAVLSDREMAHIAIAYNTGRFDPARGLKQGHQSGGKFYGENFFRLLLLAKTLAAPTPEADPVPGRAVVPPPSPVTKVGTAMRVDTREGRLRVRREPDETAVIEARLPDGHPVRALTSETVNGFIEVETSLNGALVRGFCFAEFLVRDDTINEIPFVVAAAADSRPIPPEAHLPRRSESITRRTDRATANSLNEPGRPSRSGATAAELAASLHRIVEWLAVDAANHARYAPRDNLTFCNIYAHDYCNLAKVYLPRVWWTGAATARWLRGEQVKPLLGNTVREMRADDLFAWLADFGPSFGWRRTASLTRLQQTANAGGIDLIVADRVAEGRSGHVVMIAPEGSTVVAVRDAGNKVKRPVESQAGVRNFCLGHNGRAWWREPKFVDFAFWLHD